MLRKTKIIAEIGVNHCGQLNLAKQMVDAARTCGVDIVKFQTFSAKRLVSQSTPKAEYQKINDGASESQFDMLKRLELSQPEFVELKKYCDQSNIEFCSTPFSAEDAEFLLSIDVKTIKVASPDLIDATLHELLAQSRRDIIISTGMSTYSEISETLSIYRTAGSLNRVSLLLCTSSYPTNPKDVHLNSIKTLKDKFGLPVGLSDHTETNHASFAAVALGAVIIEKHFTTDKNLPGPDQKASALPNEFAELVNGINIIEEALGLDEKPIAESEIQNLPLTRKSITAAKDLTKGHILAKSDLTFTRPGTGISPMRYNEIIGKRLVCDIKIGEQIINNNLEDNS